MDCSTPGLPVHHQLLELAQTHVHRVGDAIHHLILCQILLLLPSVFPSIRLLIIKWLTKDISIVVCTIILKRLTKIRWNY